LKFFFEEGPNTADANTQETLIDKGFEAVILNFRDEGNLVRNKKKP
jgi:hypothetical protein